MSEHNITVEGGTSVRLKTAGKYCDRDILITASGSEFTLDDIATAGYSVKGDVVLGATLMRSYAFYQAAGITSLDAPNVTGIGNYVCYQCSNITSLHIPNVTSVGTNAFQYCKNIERLDAPNLTTMGSYAFSGNASNQMAFKSINLPKCTAIPNSTLTYCAKVTELVLPECKSVGNSSLTSCTALKYVDLPKCTSIVNYGLRNNGQLATLILRSETMCTLSNYALNGTKIWNGTGHVYVPRALMTSYQTATNWKTIHAKNANAFRALEDYTVDGTITGALDPTKI